MDTVAWLREDYVDNDATLELLARMALSHAGKPGQIWLLLLI